MNINTTYINKIAHIECTLIYKLNIYIYIDRNIKYTPYKRRIVENLCTLYAAIREVYTNRIHLIFSKSSIAHEIVIEVYTNIGQHSITSLNLMAHIKNCL